MAKLLSSGNVAFSQKGILQTSVTIVQRAGVFQYNFPNLQVLQNRKILAIFEETENPNGEPKPGLGDSNDQYFITLVNYANQQVWQNLSNEFIRQITQYSGGGDFRTIPNLQGFIELDQLIAMEQSYIRYAPNTTIVAGEAVTIAIFYYDKEGV
jgi:hypothetical protein